AEEPVADPPETAGDEPREAREASLVQRLNERAREGAVTETIHGVEVADPYRALEEDSELTRAWIDAQTERAQAALDAWSSPEAAARLDTLLSIGVVGSPVVRGPRIFYTKRDA